ncbi:uncharacterized protein F4812DRAFT_415130 [Daldinia caldariorum]|uniref:uncharacterized protein n=1 Tax=Daldinia caldariorum TaxID=326644 RepID=UPI0020080B83|nr:uncharacterized protein F4812DRAFT_415130 [Daldinia caldariorum]KAI1471693.1 hypothetical protein F4812DRAFT_415130 [Daldinia caldariorum]
MLGKMTALHRVTLRINIRRTHLKPTDRLYIATTVTRFQQQHPRNITLNHQFTRKMASFSNTDTGNKPSGPYYEKNLDTDISLKEKVENLIKFVSSCKFGMMTTRDPTSGKLVSRCMAIAGKEGGDIDLTFTTNTESHKTDELKADNHTNVSFYDNSGQWASIAGEASIETDREVVKKYYSPTLKAWMGDLGDGVHDGSENDPRIAVLKVKTSSVTYAVTGKTIVSRAAEIAKGTITGEPAGVNKLREISEGEIQQWRATASK